MCLPRLNSKISALFTRLLSETISNLSTIFRGRSLRREFLCCKQAHSWISRERSSFPSVVHHNAAGFNAPYIGRCARDTLIAATDSVVCSNNGIRAAKAETDRSSSALLADNQTCIDRFTYIWIAAISLFAARAEFARPQLSQI